MGLILSKLKGGPRHLIDSLRFTAQKHRVKRAANKKTPLEKALGWVRSNIIPGRGIITHSKSNQVTQEVTGYFIPTLYHAGEKELACALAKWVASVQRPDGSFVGPDNHPYTFDTAQVIRGFLAVVDDMPELNNNLKRACEYVVSQITNEGEVFSPSYNAWELPDGSTFSIYANLYVLPPLLQAGRKLSEPMYVEAARKGMDYFKRKADLVEFKPEMSTLSHIFGYMMEALTEMGELDMARRGLTQVATIQKLNGAIPAYPGVEWVCSTGMAQLAVAWYKLAEIEPANRAMDYLEKIQNSSGGFYGSYGKGAKYFPKEEISWAVKYFIDAYLLKIKTDFNQEVHIYSEEIAENDGRVQSILSCFGGLTNKKVIDVGCGKGRYLRILKNRFPESILYGIDLSEEMLKSCPEGVETSVGTMLNIRYPDAFFDFVYSVEALEHAVAIEPAIKEMVRVLKPGGKIVIIDKNAAKLGVFRIKPWERWFNPKEITALLLKHGVATSFKPVSYDEYRADGVFISWEGVKND